MSFIVVTGASGQLGHAIVEHLLRSIPAQQIGVSVRDTDKVGDLSALGVRVRQGDYTDPDSLQHAFEDATQLLMVSSNARTTGGNPLAQHRAAIEAAEAAGARRIVYTSHMAVDSSSAFPPMLDHAATEAMLRQSRLSYTALRNSFYASSGLNLLGDALTTGIVEAPADGKVSWTAHADLAEAAAIILADEGRYDGPTPPLTSAEPLDLADITRIAAQLTGTRIQRVTISDDQMKSILADRGIPEHVTPTLIGLYIAARNGEFTSTDTTLEQLLGRPPTSMRALLADKISRQSR